MRVAFKVAVAHLLIKAENLLIYKGFINIS